MSTQTKTKETRVDTQVAVRDTWEALGRGWPGGFRERQSQTDMVEEVRVAFDAEAVAVIEAPTGTGKSLGYLAPGVPIAIATDRTLVIATATVALQEQLVNRDIPAFLAATGNDAHVDVALAKGRRRYFCPRNAHELLMKDGAQLDMGFGGAHGPWPRPAAPGEEDCVTRLAESFDKGEWDGDMDATPEPVPDHTVPLVTSSAAACSGRRCRFAQVCPVFVARERMKDAHIVVTNHDLLLADRTMRNDDGGWGGVILPLPAETLLVIDEAHALAETARSHAESRVSLRALHNRLERGRGALRGAMSLAGGSAAGLSAEAVNQAVADFEEAVQEFARDHCVPRHGQAVDGVWRAHGGRIEEDARAAAGDLRVLARRALGVVTTCIKVVSEAKAAPDRLRDGLQRELGGLKETLENHMRLWAMWADERDAAHTPIARWMTWAEGWEAEDAEMCAGPVEAARTLEAVLWRQQAGSILTSATLSAAGDFANLISTLGLQASQPRTTTLPSPFDLPNLGVIQIPRLGAIPRNQAAHSLAVARWLEDELDWNAGSLVLFTAWTRLDGVLAHLPGPLRHRVLAQGSASRADLLAEHTRSIEAGQGSVLFGLASFGAGLDLPGKLCETVVITSIPFIPPSDPISKTYDEWLRDRGGGSFGVVQMPKAMREMAQWAGRLVRSETDTGRIVLLDDRMVDMSYGKQLMAALPPFPIHVGGL